MLLDDFNPVTKGLDVVTDAYMKTSDTDSYQTVDEDTGELIRGASDMKSFIQKRDGVPRKKEKSLRLRAKEVVTERDRVFKDKESGKLLYKGDLGYEELLKKADKKHPERNKLKALKRAIRKKMGLDN